MSTNFMQLVENEIMLSEADGETAKFKRFVMETVASGSTYEELVEGLEDMDLVTMLYEAVEEIDKKEVEEIKEVFDDTSVVLLQDKKGNKSFAVVYKDKVTYIPEEGSKELVMSPAKWKAMLLSLKDGGITVVKEKSAIRDFVGFMIKAAKVVAVGAAVAIVAGALIVAISTGMAYHAQHGAALATMATRWLPFKGTHVDTLWALTSGKAAKVSGEYIVGMGGAITKALSSTATVVKKIIDEV